MTTPSPDRTSALAAIRAEVERGQRFLVTSHARPDGDAIGSAVAMGLALRHLGKAVRIVSRDDVPAAFREFPGVELIEVTDRVEDECDALFVMECGDLTRPGIAGLERHRAVNIDHHLGNTAYGAVNWFDETAAACGEMVVDVVDAIGVPLTRDIATHVYLAILTDTGSFHHSTITARTFDICRRVVEAGVDPAEVAQRVYHAFTLGRLRLMGTLLHDMRLECDGRLAVLSFDDDLLERLGASYDDSDSLINLPLSARQVRAVALFKTDHGTGEVRVSLRSKDGVDVRAVAQRYGGGGHRNAAGFTAPPGGPAARDQILRDVAEAIEKAS